ncbi:hypothetical protein [uncultured Roseibium sp.]|uniref:hypothetical protein n=1 Tax=uncultured Roseibium sp. TaxID=1936171 RepID=UPI0026036716|nr:hypothetical protein [uncultured Roseibium sp.]
MTLDPDVFLRDHVVQGDPNTDAHKPFKASLRQTLKVLGRLSAGNTINVATLAELTAVAGSTNGQGGVVWGDASATSNGVYAWDADGSPAKWVKLAGLPHTAAVLTNIGGTANAITADTETGVDPAEVQLLILPDPPGTNTAAAVTLQLNGGAVESVKATSGTDLAVGDIVAGVGAVFFRFGSEWRQLVSSRTGATFDHQGDYAAGTTYTEGQVVSGSDDAWYQLKVASATGDDPVSGGSGDWLKVFDGVPDGAITFDKLSSTAYDFLEAFSVTTGTAAATNDSNLASLESGLPNRLIDGGKKSYPVTAARTASIYRNLFWRIADYDDGLTVDVPAPETIRVNTIRLTADRFYSSWPQDKLFPWKPKGPTNTNAAEVLFAPWNESGGHGNAATHTVHMRGTAMRMGPEREHLFQRTSAGGSSWSAGEVYGQELIIEREKDSSNVTQDHHLMGRRIWENRISQGLLISTTAGSDVVDIEFTGANDGDRHGMKAGDKFIIAGASPSSVGGLSFSGTYTVASVINSAKVRLSHPGGNASSTEIAAAVTTTRFRFVEDEFSEILVDGGAGAVSLGDALADYDAVNWPNQATEFHSFGKVQDNDHIYVGIHGGSGNASGAWLVKIEDVLADAIIADLIQLSSNVDYVEPTIFHVDANGDIYGAIRHQSNSTALKLFHYDASEDAVTTHDFSDTDFAVKCVMSGDYYDGKLVACVNGTRGDTDTDPAGNVGAYILIWDTLADFIANGFTNVRAVEFAKHHWVADTFAGTDTSAVGVGSCCVLGNGVIAVLASSENPGTLLDEDGEPDIYLHLIYDLLENHNDPISLGPWSPEYVNPPEKETRFIEVSWRCSSTGTVVPRNDGGSQRHQVYTPVQSKQGTGHYRYTFQDQDGNTIDYGTDEPEILITVWETPGIARTSAVENNVFDIRTYDLAGADADKQHTVAMRIPVVWSTIY